jgi:hypothetical protein
MSLRATPARSGPNLAIQLSLYDSTGTQLTNNNPSGTLWAGLETDLPAGTYTFVVSGSGRNDPYMMDFRAMAAWAIIPLPAWLRMHGHRAGSHFRKNSPAGTRIGVVASSLPTNSPLSYAIVSGNLSNTFAIDNLGALTVSNSAVLDFEDLAKRTQATSQFELFINVTNLQDPTQIETNLRVLWL